MLSQNNVSGVQRKLCFAGPTQVLGANDTIPCRFTEASGMLAAQCTTPQSMHSSSVLGAPYSGRYF